MSAQRNRPGVGTEAIKAAAAKPFAFSDFSGDIDLTQISDGALNPRYEVFIAGWSTGYESRENEIARLRWERDLWYFCANNKGKRPSDFYTHHTDTLWEVQA